MPTRRSRPNCPADGARGMRVGPCRWRGRSAVSARLRTTVRELDRGAFVRVMGVDPGLTRCGVSIVDGALGRQVTAVAVDVVRTPPEMALPQRLLLVADAAEE